MHRRTTRYPDAMATEPFTQAIHVAATTTDTQPLATPIPVSSVAQSGHTAETPDRSFGPQPNSRRTNWGKLKEQASRDNSKRRVVLNAVNSNICFCCSHVYNEVYQTTTSTEAHDIDGSDSDDDKGSDEVNDSSDDDDHNDIAHISKKELRDMVLAAAKTALSMSKRTTRKVQRGNEAKTTKRTALQKEKDMDKGWERRLFCVSSLDL